MIKNRIGKISAIAIGMTFALGLSVNTASALTAAELQAQINVLMAQLATLQGGANANTSYTFTQNLTVGSTGGDVVSLQQFLVGGGYLNMPAGVAYGYFGSLTKAAVAKWQAANGIAPAVGYWGPLSRAKANATAMGGATGTVPGTTIGGGATVGGTISTPGVEGILSATLAPTPGAGTSVEEGADKVKVLGIELEADLSDVKIERIKVKLDQTTDETNDKDFYRDIADKMYVMDGSTVLASVSLNADTVIEETTGNYYVTITGLNYIVRKDTEKTLSIAIDAQSSWDSNFDNDTWTVTIPAEGIRGIDGAGINLYAPATGTTLARTFNTDPASADSATLTISLNASTPDAAQVIASTGSDEDEANGVEVLKFNARAEEDDVTITDLVVDLTRSSDDSANATATTAYLYDGTTLVGSATVVGTTATAMTATFDDISVTVGQDTTKVLTVKLDIADAALTAQTFIASVTADADLVSENSDGDSVTESGSATGETMSVLKVGPEFTLVSKSITKSATPESGNQSTSTATANFTIRIKAVGGNILFGSVGSTTPLVTNAGTAGTDDDVSFEIYQNGSVTALDVASSTSYDVPSGVTESSNTWTLTEGQTVDVAVSFLFEGRDDDSGAAVSTGSYAVGVAQLNWYTTAGGQQTTTFMDGESAWRTSTVTLP